MSPSASLEPIKKNNNHSSNFVNHYSPEPSFVLPTIGNHSASYILDSTKKNSVSFNLQSESLMQDDSHSKSRDNPMMVNNTS